MQRELSMLISQRRYQQLSTCLGRSIVFLNSSKIAPPGTTGCVCMCVWGVLLRFIVYSCTCILIHICMYLCLFISCIHVHAKTLIELCHIATDDFISINSIYSHCELNFSMKVSIPISNVCVYEFITTKMLLSCTTVICALNDRNRLSEPA